MLLKGENIYLRALEPEDLEVLFHWENDPLIWKVSNTVAPFSKFVLRQYLETAHEDIYTSKQLRLVIVAKSNEKAIGLIDLFDFDFFHKRAGVGILVDERERGKGYAMEAVNLLKEYVFNHLGLKQLYANITGDNERSLRMFERLNFQQSGCKKEWIRVGEEYLDEYLYQFIRVGI